MIPAVIAFFIYFLLLPLTGLIRVILFSNLFSNEYIGLQASFIIDGILIFLIYKLVVKLRKNSKDNSLIDEQTSNTNSLQYNKLAIILGVLVIPIYIYEFAQITLNVYLLNAIDKILTTFNLDAFTITSTFLNLLLLVAIITYFLIKKHNQKGKWLTIMVFIAYIINVIIFGLAFNGAYPFTQENIEKKFGVKYTDSSLKTTSVNNEYVPNEKNCAVYGEKWKEKISNEFEVKVFDKVSYNEQRDVCVGRIAELSEVGPPYQISYLILDIFSGDILNYGASPNCVLEKKEYLNNIESICSETDFKWVENGWMSGLSLWGN